MTSNLKYKHKNYYHKKNAGNSRFNIDINQKGFLCSCNFREKDCIREAYNLLNKYADDLENIQQVEDLTANSGAEDDVQQALDSEISRLKDKKSRFQVVESGAKNFLFIKTTIDDPVALASRIVRDVHDEKLQQTRYLIRLIPIEATCKAYVDDIVKAFEPLTDKYFKNERKTFSIIYSHRNNNSVSKDNVIKAVADKVTATRDDHKVDLVNAEVSIIIEIIKGFALIGVIPDYLKYKKFNLLNVDRPQPEINESN